MQKIILTVVVAFLSASLYFIGTTAAFSYSDHPMLSLAMRFIFLAVISYLIIIRRRENLVYAFLLSFPFLSIAFSGVSILIIFAVILTVVFFKPIVRYIHKGQDYFMNPLLLLLTTAILTTFIAAYKWAAIDQVIFLAGLFVVYIALKAILNSELERKRVFVILNIILSFALLIAVLQILFGVDKVKLIFGGYFTNVSQMGYVSRIPSFFKDAQEAGLFFAVMSCLTLGLSVTYSKKSLWVKTNFILSVLIIFFNGTRIAIISFVLALLYISLIKPTAKKIAVVIFIFFIICPLLWTLRSYLPDQLVHRTTQYEMNENLSFRLKVWQSAWPLIKDNPFGVGLGRKNAYAAAIKSRVNPLIIFPTLNSGQYETHFESTYLEILYSLGIAGFLCFIYIIFRFFVIVYNSATKSEVNAQNVFAKYLFGCMIIWAISVVTSPKFSYPHSMVLFMLILAFVDNRKSNREAVFLDLK